MKFLTSVLLSLICLSAYATDTPITPGPVTPSPVPTRILFSSTVDWAAVTGLPLDRYTGKIKGIDKKFVKQGLLLYYLDTFPCYGEPSNVRIWLSPNGKPDQDLRIVCVYKPETVSFAWRNAGQGASDERTTGILTCPVEGDKNFTIDISKCERGKDWKDI